MRDALGHPLRRRILRSLQRADAPKGPAALAAELRAGVSAVGYHARVLEACDSVVSSAGPSYSSDVTADRGVLAILRATRRTDDRLYK